MTDTEENVLSREEIEAKIRQIFAENPFMSKHYTLEEVHCGDATISLKTTLEEHGTYGDKVHGAVIAGLVSAVGYPASASVGAKVVTMHMAMSFIKSVAAGKTIYAHAVVSHRGRSTVALLVDIKDEDGVLLLEANTTMFVTEDIPGIPRKW